MKQTNLRHDIHSVFLTMALTGMTALMPSLGWALGSTPVTVQNTSSNPVPVTVAVDTPVNGLCSGFAAMPLSNFGNYVRCKLYTVPAGKRLIVDSVSYKLWEDVGNTVHELIFGLDNAGGFVNLNPSGKSVFIHHTRTFGDATTNAYEGTQQIHLVLEAGEIFSAQYFFAKPSTNWQQTFSFQGHLVTP